MGEQSIVLKHIANPTGLGRNMKAALTVKKDCLAQSKVALIWFEQSSYRSERTGFATTARSKQDRQSSIDHKIDGQLKITQSFLDLYGQRYHVFPWERRFVRTKINSEVTVRMDTNVRAILSSPVWVAS